MGTDNTTGKFLVFEGIDGSGKSTQIKLLSEFLKSKNQEVLVTREPGGSKFGEDCRKLFLREKLDGLTEAFLAFASRNEHIVQKIKPALQLGQWVLCDRFSDSTIAYQGYGRGVNVEFLKEIARQTEKELKEIKVIYIHTNLKTCIQRVKERGANDEKFDNLSLAFYEQIANGYSKIARDRGDNLVQIDGNKDIEKVFAEILKSVPELKRFNSDSQLMTSK